VPIAHFNISTSGIVVPISATISNSKAFKVRFKDISVISVGDIVLVDLVDKIRNIDSGV
jgi:hypothetical protein